MALWNDEQRWVTEDGVRSYFVLAGKAAPSRLECYRRIVSEPPTTLDERRGTRFGDLVRRVTEVLDIAARLPIAGR